ncbi:MAG: type VI secretion system protein TssA [Gammaproteobacteria bacterium]|nr:type VI secretion system protein TssA [Gammaproteobacteria bacterium]
MSVIDIDALLADVSDENPCGEDLEYDPAFSQMELLSKGKEEQEIGAPGTDEHRVIPAEPPDYPALRKAAEELFGQSKDLRIVIHLARSLTATTGYPGLHDTLELLKRLCEEKWDDVHPQLDPDDDNDPMMRVNTMEGLTSDETIDLVSMAPLVEMRGLGEFSLQSIAYASGDLPLPEDFKGTPPTSELIDGAFMECELDDLTATADAINESLEFLAQIDARMAEVMDITATPNLKRLKEQLLVAQSTLKDPLERRGVATQGGEEAAGPGGQQQSISGEINSREDVVRAIDKICDFYKRQEPASPVPILLRRAKKLVPKDFLEIVQDLTPAGLHEIQTIAGPDDEQQ